MRDGPSDVDPWIQAVNETLVSYRRMIDAATDQLADEEFCRRPADGTNSVAVILRHLGGNLQSRWTDFLSTDGEKNDRERDAEFRDWEGDRVSLMSYFDDGWSRLTEAITQIENLDPTKTITIRGEPHTLAQAVARSITHIAYHVGQIVLIARTVHVGEWKWLTIVPGESQSHNKKTWGTAASRSTFGETTGG